MRFDRSLGLCHSLPLPGEYLHVRLSTARRARLAIAAAGALLAREFAGTWSDDPRQMMIKYGVVRPVRPLALERPAMLAGQPLTHFLVRTSDHRGGLVLPGEEVTDPDEIVVTAQLGRSQPRYLVSLGLDWLGPCSSMSWDNKTGRMSLSCAAPPAGAGPAPFPRRWYKVRS